MADDITQQVIFDIKIAQFVFFSIQLDESTDVSACSQLMMFCRYFTDTSIKKEFLFCFALETNTKAVDVTEKISEFFKCENFKWENLCGACSDGALSMLGAKSVFQTLVPNLSPKVITVHWMINRQALASKTLPEPLPNVFKEAIKTVNYAKSGALNTQIFRKLCAEMGSEHLNLLYYTKVHWLSKGNFVARVFELREEIKKFLIMQKQHELGSNFKNNAFCCGPCLKYKDFD